MKVLIKSFLIFAIITVGSLNAQAQDVFPNTTVHWTGDPVIPCDISGFMWFGQGVSIDIQNPLLPVYETISVITTYPPQGFVFPNGAAPVTFEFCCGDGFKLIITVSYVHNYIGHGPTRALIGADLYINVISVPDPSCD